MLSLNVRGLLGFIIDTFVSQFRRVNPFYNYYWNEIKCISRFFLKMRSAERNTNITRHSSLKFLSVILESVIRKSVQKMPNI